MKKALKLITNPEPWQVLRAREDEAIVTNQPMVEKPWWWENVETGQLYYDVFGCMAWPTDVADKGLGENGYIGIIGVVRKDASIEHTDPRNADFQLIEELESLDIGILIQNCFRLQEKYELKHGFYGDPHKFVTTVAISNEAQKADLLIAPPLDFYDTNNFEIYVRALRSCIQKDRRRFYFGSNRILKKNVQGFKRDSPSIMAVGGIVHTLINQTLWMLASDGNVFNVDEDN